MTWLKSAIKAFVHEWMASESVQGDFRWPLLCTCRSEVRQRRWLRRGLANCLLHVTITSFLSKLCNRSIVQLSCYRCIVLAQQIVCFPCVSLNGRQLLLNRHFLLFKYHYLLLNYHYLLFKYHYLLFYLLFIVELSLFIVELSLFIVELSFIIILFIIYC